LPSDDRSEFESGNTTLDEFFRRYAGQNQFKHRIGTTYVALVDGRIGGFATVSPATIVTAEMPSRRGKRPTYPLPVLRLGRMAVDRQHQGAGIGANLVRHVFGLAAQMSEDLGCIGVVVDAKPEAVDFYLRLGFEALTGPAPETGAPTPMFHPLAK
jgi:GNAT superfamily N-acetyltransferase